MKAILTILFILLFSHLSHSQIMDMTWYDMTYTERQIQEQKNRDYRAEFKIKSIAILDTANGDQLSFQEFDAEGRTINVKNRKRSSYSKSDGFYEANDLLVNECKYAYDQFGSLISAKMFNEDYRGRAYGLSHGDDGEYSLPFISSPYVKDTTISGCDWSYKYDKKGLKVAQSDFVGAEPYKNQRRISNSPFGADGAAEWRYHFIYDKKGRLIKRLEFSANVQQVDPIYSLEFEYNGKGQVVSETKKSGGKVMKMIEFKYDSRGNIIEKKAPYSSMTFEYNKVNLITKIELFNHNGVSKNTIAYVYDGVDLIEKQVKGMIVNSYYKNESYSYMHNEMGQVLTKMLKNKVWTYEYY